MFQFTFYQFYSEKERIMSFNPKILSAVVPVVSTFLTSAGVKLIGKKEPQQRIVSYKCPIYGD